MRYMGKNFSGFFFLALLSLLFLGGCGGGGGNSSGGIEVVQPVPSSGLVTTPSSVSPSTLKVVSGMDSQSVNPDGSFSLNLNKDNTQLVMVVNAQNNPVLMGIAVNVQTDSTISIDIQSTAEALIYLSPGISQDDPSDAQTVMNHIKSLPETATLANLLSIKITSDPNILASDVVDTEINTALSNAIQALINKIQQYGGIQKSSLLRAAGIIPSYASGVELSYNSNTNLLEGRNYNVYPMTGEKWKLPVGSRVETNQKFCAQCGARISPDATFCKECGAKFL